MKTTLKLAVIGALMAIGVAETKAAAAKTIWVQPVNFTLTAWTDGVAKSARITTKDVIQALSGVNGSVTNPVFSKSAQLLFKMDTTSSNNTQILVVRDGKPKVDTDVTGFFGFNDLVSINGANVVISSATVTTNFKISKHNLNEFDFAGSGLSFEVAGFSAETKKSLVGLNVTVTQAASADVLGSGSTSTADVVIHGGIALGGGRLEAP